MSDLVKVPDIDWTAHRQCSGCGRWKPPRQFMTYARCRVCSKIPEEPRFLAPRPSRPYRKRSRSGERDVVITTVLAWVKNYKVTHGCSRCPERDASCLDFHHKDPNSKEASVSALARSGLPLEIVQAEIAKCEVLCANCHRKLHFVEHRVNEGAFDLQVVPDGRIDPTDPMSTAAAVVVKPTRHVSNNTPNNTPSWRALEPLALRLRTCLAGVNGKLRNFDALALAGFDARSPRRSRVVGMVLRELGWDRVRFRFDGALLYGYARGSYLEREAVIVVDRGEDGHSVVRRR